GQDERLEHGAIAHVAAHVFGGRIDVGRPRAGAVYLGLQVVEDRHAVVARDERVDQVRTDVAGSPGYEDVSDGHAGLREGPWAVGDGLWAGYGSGLGETV